MKKTLIHLLTALAVSTGLQAQAQESPAPPAKEKILIVYYSRSGNTQKITGEIEAATGGKSFKLITVKPYPDDYTETTKQARKEIDEGHKPELKAKPESIKDYDVIFVGSPCWWATMAPPVATFLSSYDFSGKTIIPFMTHEGSGLGHYVDDIRKQCPKAKVLDGKAFRGSSVKSARKDVTTWLRQIHIIK